MTLQRLVLDFRGGELVLRCLYRSEDGPGPGTKGRARVVADLARSGLRDALEALTDQVIDGDLETRIEALEAKQPTMHPTKGARRW